MSLHLLPIRTQWRQLCRSVLLPLLLLLAQQGALLHELSHYAAPEAAASRDRQHPQQTHPCDLCLAYAPLAAATAPGDVALPLLAGLHFEAATAPILALRSAELPTPRNRGPPTTL